MNYERVLSYGNIFQLGLQCDPQKLRKEIANFSFAKYNPNKDINRYGLSITSLDGEMNGPDLDTLNGKDYDELDFTELTEVYYKSKEAQKIIEPFLPWLGRTHFLNIKKGGYFPPHRDEVSGKQEAFRIIVPLHHFNPPHNYMIYNDEVVRLNEGYAYFMNTNIVHGNFSFSNDTLMMIMNIKANKFSFKELLKNMHDI